MCDLDPDGLLTDVRQWCAMAGCDSEDIRDGLKDAPCIGLLEGESSGQVLVRVAPIRRLETWQRGQR